MISWRRLKADVDVWRGFFNLLSISQQKAALLCTENTKKKLETIRSLTEVDDDYDDGDFTRNNFHSNFRNYKLTERDVNKV